MPLDTDYYSDASTEEAEVPAGDAELATEDETETGETSALLPKSLMGEVKPGDTITLRVVRIYEDEVEVEPVNETPSPPSAMEESEMGMDRYRGGMMEE